MTIQASELEVTPASSDHLIVEVSQDTYDVVMGIVQRAEQRSSEARGFQFWLERLASQHAQVQHNLWDKADMQVLLKAASNQNFTLAVRRDAAQKLSKIRGAETLAAMLAKAIEK
jgi:hypothetical protein